MYKITRQLRSFFITLVTCVIASSSGIVLADQSNANDESFKVTEEPLSLDIHFHYHHRKGSVYDNEWPVEKRAAELTGVSLNNKTPSNIENGIEALNLLIANGDLPDIVGGTGLRDKFNEYGQIGLFIPLNELINEHAPYIKAYFDDNKNVLNAISAGDGNLYHIPYIPDGKFGRAYFIRTDWLGKLGLDVPDTVDEMYEVLKQFKSRDPNGNGLADEVPYFSRTVEETVRLVTLWGARTSGSDKPYDFYLEDGRIQHGFIEEAYKHGISGLAKWYDEGLINNDMFDQNGDTRAIMLGDNIGGMTHDWFASTAGYNDRLQSTINGFSFKPIPPPAGIDGNRIEEHRRVSVRPDGWAITSSNKHIIETIKYFDFWFSPQGRRLANFGVEDKEYTMLEGNPIFTNEVLNGDMPVNKRLWTVGAQIPRGFMQDYEYEKQWTNKIALAGIEMYEQGDYLVDEFLGVVLSEKEQAVIDFYWTEIRAFMLEKQEEWIVGARDVNRDWDRYITRVNKLGMQKVLQAMQSAYDRQNSANAHPVNEMAEAVEQ